MAASPRNNLVQGGKLSLPADLEVDLDPEVEVVPVAVAVEVRVAVGRRREDLQAPAGPDLARGQDLVHPLDQDLGHVINGHVGVAPKTSGVVVARRKAVEGAEAIIITMSMKEEKVARKKDICTWMRMDIIMTNREIVIHMKKMNMVQEESLVRNCMIATIVNRKAMSLKNVLTGLFLRRHDFVIYVGRRPKFVNVELVGFVILKNIGGRNVHSVWKVSIR